MKRTKTLAALVLAVLMLASMGSAVFAGNLTATAPISATAGERAGDRADAPVVVRQTGAGILEISPGIYQQTVITLSDEEVATFREANRDAFDSPDNEELVGITFIVPGTLTREQQADFVAAFVSYGAAFEALPETKEEYVPEFETDILPGWELRNLVWARNAGFTLIHAMEGPRNMRLQISHTRGISNSWSATGGISAAQVSAGVGFSVTESRNVTATATWTVPNNWNRGRIEARAMFDRRNFQVWRRPLLGSWSHVGNGHAWQFNNTTGIFTFRIN